MLSRQTATLAATILGSSLAFIDGSVVNVALPTIQNAFGASAAATSWMINAYALPLGALVLLFGAAGDRYGKRRLFVWGTILFTAASILCALAPSLSLLLAGRVLQGIGGAMLMPNSLALIGIAFDGEARGRAIGTWSAVGAIGGAIGPVLGGWLVDSVSWRAIFFINVPLALGAIFLSLRYVEEHRRHDAAPLDWVGASLATAGLAALTWGLTIASTAMAGPFAWGAIALGIVLLIVFVLVEARTGKIAMMPVKLFGTPTFVGVTILTFFLYAALGGLFVLLPYLLIRVGHYDATVAGASLLPLPLILGAASRSTGRLAEKTGPRLLLTIGPFTAAIGFALFARVASADIEYWRVIFPALLLLACGMALSVAPLTTTVMASVDADHAGSASGINNAVARIAGLLAVAVLGFALADATEDRFVANFRIAVLGAAAMAVAASAAGLLLVRNPQR
ncbi:MFS transporter [Roseiterribacter gracilis]|uniref:MFS transporter n=1 Tax=Roseiterribacter gracilis TaxID=2812848 RepID=A0A8S8XE29_9PROT|nr:MFS transporter [Rhodospirillales bacterium TMPK1]